MSKLGWTVGMAFVLSFGCGPADEPQGDDAAVAMPDAAMPTEDAGSCEPVLETCNEVDDDCDGTVDETVSLTFYVDADGDGFGLETSTVMACAVPAGHAAVSGDCDDACPSCHPGGTEVCDGSDQDCVGGVDDGVLVTFYRDEDGDGFGVPGITADACAPPAGFVLDATDCDDACPSCYPGGVEICDDLDQDCDGDAVEVALRTSYFVDADGDGYSPGLTDTVRACALPAGYTARVPAPDATDCADGDARAFPGQTEFQTTVVVGATGVIARWDFDCNGATEGQYGIFGSCDTSIACTGTVGAFVGATRPECGASALFQDSCGRGGLIECMSVTSTRAQACR